MMRRYTALLTTVLLLAAWPVLAQPRPGSFTTLTATSTTTGTLTVSNTGASAIDVAGGVNAGSGNVSIIGTDGRIPDISSTTFASLSGTNLTGVARLASSESISGTWTTNNNVSFQSRNNAASAMNLAMVTSSNEVILGPTAAQIAGGVGVNTFVTASSVLNLFTNGTSWTTVNNTGTLTHTAAHAWTGVISPAALANGNNNNYNPTGLAAASFVILTADAGGSTITGLTAQPSGTEITLCEPSPGASSLTLASESGSSTAANRFNTGAGGSITLNKDTAGGVAGPCATFWYYGAGSRWLLKSTSTSVP